MSENKKVIRVKDLVIEAENVIIETKRRHDPFFGGFRREREEERLESSIRESVSVERDGDDERDRRPFSWI
ncbi:hypothetical protein [Ornithinibacillus bavariensis]|uniref:Uncharacterized protein n=1 Tax=Ornithinibacillus bavariensis TaxID=545502 RepID=A0A920C4M1_9BACI|nr:hypothetical protein [Ornithinibacillus bavariensis]GIO25780.1 hypothetical protein J43TS3_03910 [Ornithinibacillus bavariensis]HAM79814.1 hypothetical protein [Ornithinibacillus sp.]